MEAIFLKTIKNTIKDWYIPIHVCAFFVIVRIGAFTKLAGSLFALNLLFVWSFLFGRLSEIISSVADQHQLSNWGWSLAFGIVTFVIGLLLMLNPTVSITVLAFYIGFVILFRFISKIGFAIDIKKYDSKNRVGLLVLGIVVTIVPFILIWNPLFVGMSVVELVTLSFLFAGLFRILLVFHLRVLHKSSKKISALNWQNVMMPYGRDSRRME